jgi:hypothetical protein
MSVAPIDLIDGSDPALAQHIEMYKRTKAA